MAAARPLTGIIPPVCTPFTEDGDVDVPSLERLIGYLLDNGVHGLFMLGSTSETATLTDRAARDDHRCRGAYRGWEGAGPGRGDRHGDPAARSTTALTARRLGVDGLVATAPFYIRPSQDEIAAHYRMLRSKVDLPILAYDIPQNVHVKLERSTHCHPRPRGRDRWPEGQQRRGGRTSAAC